MLQGKDCLFALILCAIDVCCRPYRILSYMLSATLQVLVSHFSRVALKSVDQTPFKAMCESAAEGGRSGAGKSRGECEVWLQRYAKLYCQ